MTNIVIADHNRLVGQGIAKLLTDDKRIRSITRVMNMDELIRHIRGQETDILLLDLNLPPAGGLEAIRRVLRVCEKLAIIGLGINPDGPYPARLLELGARGLLTKGCEGSELLEAVFKVRGGQLHLGADLAQSMVMNSLVPGESSVSSLSTRELAVMVLVAQGRRPREISERLCISPKTVSTYRSRLCRKLGVQTDVELTHLSLKHGLIEASYCS